MKPTLFDLSLVRVAICAAALCAIQPGPSRAVELPKPDRFGVPESKLFDYGVMGPPATPAVVAAAARAVRTPMAPGPVEPNWTSLAANYTTPAWLADTQFAIFIHWGPYSAAAHHNEWYEKHMYTKADGRWHAEHFGPQERFGYKDLIPLFTAKNFDPGEWAALFRASGARLVIPTAQHHDNFALWDSKITPYNAVRMGPKRDLIGELGVAVRNQGLHFGVSNHGMENFAFINPSPDIDARLRAAKADLYDPAWAGFYNVADRSDRAMAGFLADWTERNFELIDKYQPDILWFDNGVNLRVLDPLKLQVAAYYYNRARSWNRQVSISTKFVAFAPSNDDRKQIASVIDFEKVGTRSPSDIRPGPWFVDDAIGSTWGYTEGMTVSPPATILNRLVDTVAKGGTYLLNISPMADGTIPQAQKATLQAIGAWLSANGEAIYGAAPWRQAGEGDIRFTRKGKDVYAIILRPLKDAAVPALSTQAGKIASVRRLDEQGDVEFRQDGGGLVLDIQPGPFPVAYKIVFE
jgi:alpha-L-fucosidase